MAPSCVARRGDAMLAASCAASRASRTSLRLSLSAPGRRNGTRLRLVRGCRVLRAPPSALTRSVPMRHQRNREPVGTAPAANSQACGTRYGCIRPFFQPASSFRRSARVRRSRARLPDSARPWPPRRTQFAVLLSISDPTSSNDRASDVRWHVLARRSRMTGREDPCPQTRSS